MNRDELQVLVSFIHFNGLEDTPLKDVITDFKKWYESGVK